MRGHDSQSAHRTALSLGVDGFLHGIFHLFGRNLFFKFHHIVATTGKVDTALQTTHTETHGTGCNEHGNDNGRLFGDAHESKVRVGEEFLRETGGEGQFRPLVAVEEVLISDAREPNGREERSHDTDAERQGEAADRTRTEVVEDHRRDDRCEVGVEDGGEGVAVTVGKSLLQVLAGAQFFFRTLIDEHVGVHRHTEREHHTGQSAQRQCRLE